VEQYRFEARVHGLQQVETAATSTLAHVQQFAVASTTETDETLVGRADVEWHIMREDTVVEQATAKEITHEDVEVPRQCYAQFSTHTTVCPEKRGYKLFIVTTALISRYLPFWHVG